MSRAVLITGCSTGIGRAVMERLTVSGHAVVATAGRAESLKGVAVSSGLVLDVSDSAATGSCRRRDPAAARAYRRAAQRCRVRRPRSSRGGPGRCGRGNGRRQRFRRLADGPPRSLLSATTLRARLSDGKSGDHLGLSRRSARALRGEPVRVMRVNRLACWQTGGGVEDDRFSRSGRRGSSAR